MAWSKVRKDKYPLGWWKHKILLEFFYWMGNYDRYFHHVQQCTKYGFNIYGDKITPNKTLNKV